MIDAKGEPQLDHRVYLDGQLENPEVFACGIGSVAVYSRRSPTKEANNQDAAIVLLRDQSAVLAVADGCGGMAQGHLAAQLATRAFCDSFRDAELPLRSVILNGIEQANQSICGLGTGAATTVAVAEIDHQVIRPYHVGDSQILLVGNHGKIKLQTRCHSPVGYAVEAGVISEQDAILHEDRHLVSNLLGTAEMSIEIGPPRAMSPRDTLLIASDGLYDNLHIPEIVEMVRKGNLGDAARNLAQAANLRMLGAEVPCKPDDLTFILFRLNPQASA